MGKQEQDSDFINLREICGERSEYRNRFEALWNDRIVATGTLAGLENETRLLKANLEGSSNALSLPGLLVSTLESFTGRMTTADEVFAEKFLSAMVSALCHPGFLSPTLSGQQKDRLLAAVSGVKGAALCEAEMLKQQINYDAVWLSLVSGDSKVSRAFLQTLWKLSEMCYCSLYFSYEDFVVKSIRKLRKDDSINNRDGQKFKREFIHAVSEDAYLNFYESDRVKVHREIRNALAHRGGEPNEYLIGKNGKGVELVHGVVAVGSPHGWNLLQCVCQWSGGFLDAIVKKSGRA